MSHDVLVIGAGPAGCAAAAHLAAMGLSVALVGPPARAGWEGLSRRSLGLLVEEGLAERSGLFDGPCPRRGVWAGSRAVAGTEWLVERRALAEALRARARAAGVDDRRDTVATLEREHGRWRGGLRSGALLSAPMVVEARGRRGPERRGPLLLAVGQQFRRRAHGGPVAVAQLGTHLYAADFGWCWWAARSDALWVQVVGRPRSAAGPAAGGVAAQRPTGAQRPIGGPRTIAASRPDAWLAAAAAQIPALAQALDGYEPEGGAAACGPAFGGRAAGAPAARPAHARLSLTPGNATRWRVGDAAFALDPLSGQGVYEALRGARLVATAVQSVLRGEDPAPALRFVAERQQESWAGGVRAAAAFYRENVGHYGETAGPGAETAGRGTFWADTADAYERLLPAAVAVAPHVARRPVLDGDRIVERDVIVTAQHPRGVWHVADVPLASLKGYLESAERVSLTGAAAAFGRSEAAVASAIHWLQQTGITARRLAPHVPLGG